MIVGRKEIHDIPSPTISAVCAIIVLFHPDADIDKRLQMIMAQFPLAVLVDNTPGGSVLPVLSPSVHWLRNNQNLGIAAALNQGFDLAIELGCEWCATFDQDSELLPGYLKRVMAIASQHTPMPVLVGCNYLNVGATEATYKAPAGTIDAWQRATLITSGTFIPIRFVRAVGGFREDYFIDSVDHEFCLRARSYGARVLMTVEPFMRHRMGNAGVGFFGLLFSLQHPEKRRYYMARNTLLTIRTHGTRYPLWTLRHICRLLAEGFAIIFLESEKGPKLRAFARGLWHGLTGRSGPLEKI